MADSAAEKSNKNKKINRLTLAEIEAKLEEIKKNEGHWKSRYARALLARKKVLTGSH
ncbi:MAG: hypothetical protein QME28_06945 [Candidatus Saccharicenans sp.]|nr:hypothetical protein [Candidatus Saccharicenans sp.]